MSYQQRKDDFLAKVRTAGGERLVEMIEPQIAPGFSMIPANTETCSFLGGQPTLPDELQWPIHNSLSYMFVGQICLDEVPDEIAERQLLPKTGMLFFFILEEYLVEGALAEKIGEDFKKNAYVLYWPETTNLASIPYPEGHKEQFYGGYVLNQQYVKFEAIPTLEQFPNTGDEDSEENFSEQWSTVDKRSTCYGKLHQLLGTAFDIQHGIEYGLGYYAPKEGTDYPNSEEWTLLMQVDSDDNGVEYMWGDAGIYFYIPKAMLAQGDFSHIMAFEECY